MVTVLACDLGASNGRLTAQMFDGQKITLEEIYRFSNEPLKKGKHFYWDFEHLLNEVTTGIEKSKQLKPSTFGIDTWGVDFGMINKREQLIQLPFCYRDEHTLPHVEKAKKMMDPFQLYEMSGNEISSINTMYQLMAIQESYPHLLEESKSILMMPSLFIHALTGAHVNEYTISSTTQLLNSKTGNWNKQLIETIFGRTLSLAPIKKTHELVGPLKNNPSIQIALVPGHDTACALSALPISKKGSAFISLGTWGLVGVEREKPVITIEAFKGGYTNEGTSEGETRFQKNATGYWILQQLRKQWGKDGSELSFEHEQQLFDQATPFRSLINVDDPSFFNPDSMEDAIQSYCKETGQLVPETKGQFLRCFNESIALYYANIIEEIEKLTNETLEEIYIGGGGAKNTMLCQLIANATNKIVIAGPYEASSIGNGLSQLRALKEISSCAEGRMIVRASFPVKNYEPKDIEIWQEKKHYIQTITGVSVNELF